MTVGLRDLNRLVERLEGAPLLGEADRVLTRWLEPLVGDVRAPRVLDALHGRWLGHPLHPALSDLPIGFWAATALLDLAGARVAAGITSAAGTIGGLAAAASGLADWHESFGRERRLGLLHGSLNAAGLALNATSLAARLGGQGRLARRLGYLGLGVSAGAAWLGGELVFGRGLSVARTAFEAGPESWTPALPAAELPDGATRCAEVAGRAVLLHRWRGRISALAATCTHAGGPLCEGEMKDGSVTCPWHGSTFSLRDGAIERGPAVFPQPELETRVRQGKVEVRAPES